MDWQEEYRRKLVSAEEAVKVVKPGDRVEITSPWEPEALQDALAARWQELSDVRICSRTARPEHPWFRPERLQAFYVQSQVPRRAWGFSGEGTESAETQPPYLTTLRFKPEEEREGQRREIDVFMVVTSKPDRNGFCSFGLALGSKRTYASRARKVLAEVNDLPFTSVRTCGENHIHVSEIEHFVEHEPSPQARFVPWERQRRVGEEEKQIARHVAALIRDGDTIEVGIGAVAEAMLEAGVFTEKRDLGVHTGTGFRGMVGLVRDGVVNGRFKTLNRGKAVMGSVAALDNEIDFVHNNPAFELRSLEYVHDLKVLAAHDNFVAVNSILAIDLNGQITSESLGGELLGLSGGLPPFTLGALHSRGGRSINVVRSTTPGGRASCIVPRFKEGTMVTLPRYLVDYVVTEYGVASLMGKTQRERIDELIAIAHPDFRAELRREAQRLL